MYSYKNVLFLLDRLSALTFFLIFPFPSSCPFCLFHPHSFSLLSSPTLPSQFLSFPFLPSSLHHFTPLHFTLLLSHSISFFICPSLFSVYLSASPLLSPFPSSFPALSSSPSFLCPFPPFPFPTLFSIPVSPFFFPWKGGVDMGTLQVLQRLGDAYSFYSF